MWTVSGHLMLYITDYSIWWFTSYQNQRITNQAGTWALTFNLMCSWILKIPNSLFAEPEHERLKLWLTLSWQHAGLMIWLLLTGPKRLFTHPELILSSNQMVIFRYWRGAVNSGPCSVTLGIEARERKFLIKLKAVIIVLVMCYRGKTTTIPGWTSLKWSSRNALNISSA